MSKLAIQLRTIENFDGSVTFHADYAEQLGTFPDGRSRWAVSLAGNLAEAVGGLVLLLAQEGLVSIRDMNPKSRGKVPGLAESTRKPTVVSDTPKEGI